MRTRTDRTVVEKKIYIADDGKEFLNEEDCRFHEIDIAYDKACEAYSKMRKFEAFPPFCADGDFIWTWVYLTSKKDLDAVKGALYCDDCTAIDYTPESYPCWAAFAHDENGYGDAAGTISDYRSDALRYINTVIEKQQQAKNTRRKQKRREQHEREKRTFHRREDGIPCRRWEAL